MTHLKWADGCVETHDPLLPYPKKVTTSAAVAQSTLPPPCCRDIVEESVSTEALPASAVPYDCGEVRDAWASYDAEQSEAFWRNSSTGSSRAVDQQTAESVASIEVSPIILTTGHDACAVSDTKDGRHSSSGNSCAVNESTCSEAFENASYRTSDGDKNSLLSVSRFSQNTTDTEKQETVRSLTAEEETVGNVSTKTRDSALTIAQVSCGRNLLGLDAVFATVDSEMENTVCQMEESSPNIDEIDRACTDISAAGSSSVADMSSAAECICRGHTGCDLACSVSSSCSFLAGDDTNVDAMHESDRDISVDCRCVVNDSDADTCVLDDTEDSDVDENFFASRPLWLTAMKRDPYRMKEDLVLSLEEVICDNNNS